ncbi:MAG: hypothetical protein LBM02_08060 [Lachnospiraceae bacterium]|jgi:hypothetical protein|nr:hypothetical protein [Lachnospiraceae bacterium]
MSSSLNCTELLEELKYKEETNRLFYQENKILKKELHSLTERLEAVEEFRDKISLILNNEENSSIKDKLMELI